MRSPNQTQLLSLAAVATMAAVFVQPAVADAGVHIRLAGRVSGSVHIRHPRVRYVPRPVIRWWPSTYVVYPQYHYEQPAYVAPRQPGGPSSYSAAPTRKPLSKFAIGGSLGMTTLVDMDTEAVADRGERGLVVQGRFADHWLLEGTLRQSVEPATDTRRSYVGAGLIAELAPWSAFTPYALVGVGKDTNSDGGYAELGGGLRLNLGDSLQINADLRGGSMAEYAEVGGIQAADPQELRFNKFQLAALIRF